MRDAAGDPRLVGASERWKVEGERWKVKGGERIPIGVTIVTWIRMGGG